MENWNLSVPDKPEFVEEKSKQLEKFSSGDRDSVDSNEDGEKYFLQIIPKKEILFFSKVKQVQGDLSNSFESLVNYNATALEETEQDVINEDTTDQNSEDDKDNVTSEHSAASSDIALGCPEKHDECGKQFTNFVVSCNVDQLFKMMFTDSKFMRDFHSDRGTTDVIQTEWIVPENKSSNKSRTLTFIALTGQRLGPKHAHVTESQTLMQGSEPGSYYAVNSESINEGIPCADAFSVNCHYCLSAASESESRLMIFGKVSIKRNVWTKHLIEKNTMVALEDYFKQLEAAIEQECIKLKNNSTKSITADSVCKCSRIQELNNRNQNQGILDASNQRLLLIILMIMVLINGYLITGSFAAT